jgi:hypothetical protein
MMGALMRIDTRRAMLVLLTSALMACDGVTTPTPDNPGNPGQQVPIGTPITTFTTAASGSCPAIRSKTVLVDPTHDGGVWWFPQAASSPDGFNPDAPHQGQALANYLRAQGYTVTELGRGATLPTDSMRTYATVIRAGYWYDADHPGYSAADLAAYEAYLACGRTLVLLGEFLRDGRRDDVADALGIPLTGIITSTITDFTAHTVTTGVSSAPFIAGSYLESESNNKIQVLGRLPSGEAVMGVLAKGDAKVFFIGDMNGIQQLPQPLVQNLVAWGFQ